MLYPSVINLFKGKTSKYIGILSGRLSNLNTSPSLAVVG